MHSSSTIIIIQARFGSSRLPGKIMKELLGRPMIWHIVERCRKSKEAGEVLVAITKRKDDDRAAKFFDKNGIVYYRGSSEDVLGRYFQAAKANKANIIVRVTGDCPFIDPQIIDLCIKKFRRSRYDYLSNIVPGRRTFPRGLDVEVFSFEALEKAAREASQLYEREHVTPYIWENKKDEFRIGPMVTASSGYAASYRLTVDYPEDFSLTTKLYEVLCRPGTIIDAREVISFLDKHPKVADINKHCIQKPTKSPDRTYKILIVGVGSIGLRHFRNLLSLGYWNIAVCDKDKNKLKVASKLLRGVGLYTDVVQALGRERPSIVFICTPTHLHVPLARLALQYNADLFIEKPLSHSLKGIDGLIRQVGNRRRIVMVACNWRFRRAWQKLLSVIRTHRYGKTIFARVALGYYLPSARPHTNYKKIYVAKKRGGGVILDSGCHVADYLVELFGKIRQGAVLAGRLHSLKIQSEEAAHLLFEHQNGVTSAVTLDYLSPKPRHLVEVMTESGLLTLDMRKDFLTLEDGTEKKTIYRGRGTINQLFVDEIEHFLNCVANRKKPTQGLGGAREVLKTIFSTKRL